MIVFEDTVGIIEQGILTLRRIPLISFDQTFLS
jgi:hypothetical protein